jgi:hypothetical protein
MARLAAPMWFYNRQQSTIGSVIRAMVPALIEQQKSFVFQKRAGLAKRMLPGVALILSISFSRRDNPYFPRNHK